MKLPTLRKYEVWVDITGQYIYDDVMAESYEDAREISKERARADAGRGHLLSISISDCELKFEQQD